ncbi:MAG: CAP domain-containing protein [Coprobacillus cateniformis]
MMLASAKEAFQLQNRERAKQGLAALQWSDSLYETAKIRAKEIVTQFSHTRPNGGDIFDMIQISWKSAGENIGMGTPLASSMVNMWMNSAGHKANILADNTHAAVAKYGNYWVTIFVKQ